MLQQWPEGETMRRMCPDCHRFHDVLCSAESVSQSDGRRAAFLEAADYIRRQWLAAYPVEVFPEPPKPPAECSRDRISAAMGRHMATKLIEHFEAAANTKEGGGDG